MKAKKIGIIQFNFQSIAQWNAVIERLEGIRYRLFNVISIESSVFHYTPSVYGNRGIFIISLLHNQFQSKKISSVNLAILNRNLYA